MTAFVVNPVYANWSHEHDRTEPMCIVTYDGTKSVVYSDTVPDYKGVTVRKIKWELIQERITDAVFKGSKLVSLNLQDERIKPIWIELRGVDAENAIPLLFKTTVDLTRDLANIDAHRSTVNDAIVETLGHDRMLNRHKSPSTWTKSNAKRIIQDAIEDTLSIYDLWKFGATKGFIRLRSRVTGEVEEVQVNWNQEGEI